MKRVTKDEFDDFIVSYGKPLSQDILRICEPPVLTYYDTSDGKRWPDSVIAKVTLDEAGGYRYFVGGA